MRALPVALGLLVMTIAPATAWPAVTTEAAGLWTVAAGGADAAEAEVDGLARAVPGVLRIEGYSATLGLSWRVRTAEAVYHCQNGVAGYQPVAAGVSPVVHTWGSGSCSLADTGAPWTPAWQGDLAGGAGATLRGLRGTGSFG